MQTPESALTPPANNAVHRVLVIDDNASIHEDFRKILGDISPARASLRGLQAAVLDTPGTALNLTTFEIDCASQGEEGLGFVQRAQESGHPYALAFVDGRMPPGWDGIETIHRLWAEQPDLQVVLCTAYSDYAWNEIQHALGATDNLVILKKPFDNMEALQLAHALSKKWDLNRQAQGRLADLDRLVKERTGQMRQALALFEASIAQSPLGILIAEAPEVTVRWANAAALGLVGNGAESLGEIEVRRRVTDWPTFRPDGSPYPATEGPLSRAVLQGEITRNEELIVRNRKGEDRWVSVNAAPIRDSHGTVTAGIALLHDLTERKHAEQEKERLRAQFVQAQKMESVGRLAGGVAHDFNNMLQAILGYVELALEASSGSNQVQEELRQIRKAAQRSTDLTRQLLAFARRQTIHPKVLDLNEVVSSTIKMLQRLIGENIELRWLPGHNLGSVRIDPSQIDQVLANLTVNARDAIAGAGKVTIQTTNLKLDATSARQHPGVTPGDYVALSVSDTGCGMDEETRSHLFEPFFTTKGVGKGTGLGLATVFGVVEQNGGFIDVHTKPGRGSTFWICLPRSVVAAPHANTEMIVKPMARGTGTVLLVEDEPLILSLASHVLAQHGYTVLPAPTPEAALAIAEQHPDGIRLLITDVVMPGMNGKQLHERLRACHPELPCLFMSGYPSDVITQQGVLDDDVQFLQKPFAVRELAEKVRVLLEHERETS